MIASLNELALNILRGINNVVGNYGWSIVVFTVLIRLVLSPFDFKSRVGMRKMASLSTKQAELQRKYGKDIDQPARKTVCLRAEDRTAGF